MNAPKFLVWIDLETCGGDITKEILNPDKVTILEFAMVVTDLNLNEVLRYHRPIWSSTWFQTLRIDEWALEHHTKNGLVNDLQRSADTVTSTSLTTAWNLLSLGVPGEFMIAGSGVANFDFPIIKRRMPDLAKFFQYAAMDIGPIRRFFQYVLNRPDLVLEADDNHRALPDVLNAIEQAKLYREIIREGVIP